MAPQTCLRHPRKIALCISHPATFASVHRSGGASGVLGTARLSGQTSGAVLLAMIFSVADAHGRGQVVALGLAAVFASVAAVFSLRRLRHAAH